MRVVWDTPSTHLYSIGVNPIGKTQKRPQQRKLVDNQQQKRNQIDLIPTPCWPNTMEVWCSVQTTKFYVQCKVKFVESQF